MEELKNTLRKWAENDDNFVFWFNLPGKLEKKIKIKDVDFKIEEKEDSWVILILFTINKDHYPFFHNGKIPKRMANSLDLFFESELGFNLLSKGGWFDSNEKPNYIDCHLTLELGDPLGEMKEGIESTTGSLKSITGSNSISPEVVRSVKEAHISEGPVLSPSTEDELLNLVKSNLTKVINKDQISTRKKGNLFIIENDCE